MALVPFRSRGPAADQTAEERLIQICGLAILIRQIPNASMEMKRNKVPESLTWAESEGDPVRSLEQVKSITTTTTTTTAAAAAAAKRQAEHAGKGSSSSPILKAESAGMGAMEKSDLSTGCDLAELGPPVPSDRLGSVGFVAWQCGELLATLLLTRPPCSSAGEGWHGVRVIDLGCGTGIVGIALALAGASVTLSDLEHVLPLAEENARVNCERHGISTVPKIKEHVWGDRGTVRSLREPCRPDLITASDVLYNPSYYSALLDSLALLCAPHTVTYISWKKRHVEEESFVTMAEGRGFVVDQIPSEYLMEDYQDGTFVVLRLILLDCMELD